MYGYTKLYLKKYFNINSEFNPKNIAFFYKNHEVIDKIGSDIRCSNIDTGWDGVDTYDYTKIDQMMEILLKVY